MNPNNRKRAYVTIEDINIDVMIDGLYLQNCALNGDRVLIEMLPVTKWSDYPAGASVPKPLDKTEMLNRITNDSAVEQRLVDSVRYN